MGTQDMSNVELDGMDAGDIYELARPIAKGLSEKSADALMLLIEDKDLSIREPIHPATYRALERKGLYRYGHTTELAAYVATIVGNMRFDREQKEKLAKLGAAQFYADDFYAVAITDGWDHTSTYYRQSEAIMINAIMDEHNLSQQDALTVREIMADGDWVVSWSLEVLAQRKQDELCDQAENAFNTHMDVIRDESEPSPTPGDQSWARFVKALDVAYPGSGKDADRIAAVAERDDICIGAAVYKIVTEGAHNCAPTEVEAQALLALFVANVEEIPGVDPSVWTSLAAKGLVTILDGPTVRGRQLCELMESATNDAVTERYRSETERYRDYVDAETQEADRRFAADTAAFYAEPVSASDDSGPVPNLREGDGWFTGRN